MMLRIGDELIRKCFIIVDNVDILLHYLRQMRGYEYSVVLLNSNDEPIDIV